MPATIAPPVNRPRIVILHTAMALALSVLLALSAQVKVPFWPVPMTLQTLAVFTIAGIGGARLGGATVLAYLAEGAAGLPVFANGGGMGYLLGPTGGYLLGMLPAAVLVGELTRRAEGRTLPVGVAMLLGTALVYGAGAAWLAAFLGPGQAFVIGVQPFLLGDAVKALLAAALVLAAKPAPRGTI